MVGPTGPRADRPTGRRVNRSTGEMEPGADFLAFPVQPVENLHRFGCLFLEEGDSFIFEKVFHLGVGFHEPGFSPADHNIFRPGIDKIGHVLRGYHMTAFSPPFGYHGVVDNFDVVMVGFTVYNDVAEGITVDHVITCAVCSIHRGMTQSNTPKSSSNLTAG